eukprot:gene9574-8554_t
MQCRHCDARVALAKFCGDCGKPQAPSPPPVAARAGEACGECESERAAVACKECGDVFCRPCAASLHAKGRNASHTVLGLDTGPAPAAPGGEAPAAVCGECESRAPDVQCAQCGD